MYIYLFLLFYISFYLTPFVYATDIQKLNLQHSFWKDTIEITPDKRFCRMTIKDCGVIIKQTKNSVTLKWDKYDEETFNLHSNGLYVLVDTRYTIQDKLDKEMNTAYENLEHSFENPYVKLNPYNRTPLTALIKFPTQKPASITIKIKGIGNAPDLIKTYSENKREHVLPIIGLYPNHRNEVELMALFNDNTMQKTTIFIQTPLLKGTPFYQIIHKKDKKNHFYHASDGIVYDEYGYIRFHILAGNDLYYMLQGEIVKENRITGLERYTLLGKLIKKYPYPKGFQSFTHGIGQKPNGNFLVIGSYEGTTALIEEKKQETHRDFVIELDYETGELIKKWDLAEILNPDRSVIIKSATIDYGKNDWCHINSVDYDPTDNSLVVSCRHVGMIKIDEKTGHLKWLFGPNKGFEKSGRNGDGPSISNKVLTAVNSKGIPYPKAVQNGIQKADGFKWPTKTHHARFTQKDIFSIFDNSGKLYDSSIFTTENSVASVFQIDEKKKTVKQLFLKNLEAYSPVGSAVYYFPTENEVLVFLSQVKDKNSQNMTYGEIRRYNATTEKEIMRAVIYGGGESWHYRIEPALF